MRTSERQVSRGEREREREGRLQDISGVAVGAGGLVACFDDEDMEEAEEKEEEESVPCEEEVILRMRRTPRVSSMCMARVEMRQNRGAKLYPVTHTSGRQGLVSSPKAGARRCMKPRARRTPVPMCFPMMNTNGKGNRRGKCFPMRGIAAPSAETARMMKIEPM